MSESVQGLARDLTRELNWLLDRLRSWSPASWDVRAAAGGTRAERTAAFSRELARLGRVAGSAAPDGAQPPPLAPHGLADQATVLAEDLLGLLGRPGLDSARRSQLVAEAYQVVTAARADLDGAGFGFAAARGR
ncbi:hypothetical protein [Pseudofrankia sp. BMG5.36]|uniref:hypothetical protein n=1 Tax=Pseudofrankia sp. BMG5.36 TaxID=1834512 RepID=UPI0008DA3BA5|nr:hypothetical protein [Pseudofrankia sp. BMG5.36]OHV48165.1 hypothetical protein BCD48_16330 [Pseudofrankia sp. BMG5.36]